MKIVINACYGGFSLSPESMIEYYKRKGRDCYFFTFRRKPGGDIDFSKFDSASPKDVENRLIFSAFDVPNPNDFRDDDEWYGQHCLSQYEYDRTDTDLIDVVEKLGGDSSGRGGDLRVIEIPDGVEWTIEEYDGREWVAEKHRTWGAEK